MVEAYWALLVAEKSTEDNERRRWLRIDGLDRELQVTGCATATTTPPPIPPPPHVIHLLPVQARKYVEALTGRALPDGPLQPALASGEALCDTVNVFLIASGLKPIKPERKAAAEGQAAQSRLRAKQMENITQYLKAYVDLGVPKAQLFDAEGPVRRPQLRDRRRASSSSPPTSSRTRTGRSC